MLNIVLVEPEIPQNTGNIARLCANTGCKLHLVRPLGFSVDDKYLKRAGLDHWHIVDITYYDSFEELSTKFAKANFYFATTKAKSFYTDMTYGEGDFLVFGRETKGLPESILDANVNNCIKIPQNTQARSLNLANSVAVITYEALRQLGFSNLE